MFKLTNEQKAVAKEFFFQMISDVDMFRGHYDAKNGDEHFMFGISIPLNYLAYAIDEEYGERFDSMFMKNMCESLDKVLKVWYNNIRKWGKHNEWFNLFRNI